MLKITRVASLNHEVTLQLDGRVAGPDLQNIAFVDCEGVGLIRGLIDRGVRQVNAPLFVAEQIKKCWDEDE